MDKIKFQTNVPVEVALRFTEGKLCDSQFGDPQYMFSTTDDRAFFVAAKVAQKIHGLRLKPGELIDIVKAEVPYTNGRKGIEWQVTRVNPPEGEGPNPPVGEQTNGTFVVPASQTNGAPSVGRVVPANGHQPGASVGAPAPVTAAPVLLPAQPPCNGNGSANGHANGNDNPHPVIADGRPRIRLEDALKTVVAAVHATDEYAKTIGYAMPQFTSEDLRTMANTIMIGAKNGGN
ncbi:hypothetical protein SBA4_1750018 [Candidatus Sulfopaludibacter sp. SbA4]|nr:hypothetical protein SBA4_1750018 [Candidatus Sulfopaludibacter sp. SbA4]